MADNTIHIFVKTILDEYALDKTTRKLAGELERHGHEAGKGWTHGFSDELVKRSPAMQKALNNLTTLTEKAEEAQRAYSNEVERQAQLSDKTAADLERITRLRDRASQAHRREADQLRVAGEEAKKYSLMESLSSEAAARERSRRSAEHIKQIYAEAAAEETRASKFRKADEQVARKVEASARNQQRIREKAQRDQDRFDAQVAAHTLTKQLATFGRTAGQLGRGSLFAGAPVIIYELVSAASELSGVLGLIPGVAGAAAVGMGTLTLGMQGFSDVIKDVGDTEKFVEGLRNLSPEAQQAALSIRALIPEFKALKNATQDALFAGVGPQIEKTFASLGPTIQQTTTGVASAFNQMFMSLTNEISSGGAKSSLENFGANVVAGFQNLDRAVAPVTDAFTKLMEVSSGFLPELASDIGAVAEQFNQFIQDSAADGSLEDWINRGVVAAGKLIGTIDDIAAAFESFASGGAIDELVHSIESISFAIRVLNGDISSLTEAGPTAMDSLVGQFQDLADIVNLAASGMNFLIESSNSLFGTSFKTLPDDMKFEYDRDTGNVRFGNMSKQQEAQAQDRGFYRTPAQRSINRTSLGDQTDAGGRPIPSSYGTGSGSGGQNKLQKWTNPATGVEMIWVPTLGGWVDPADPRVPEWLRKEAGASSGGGGSRTKPNIPHSQVSLEGTPIGAFQGLGPQGVAGLQPNFSGLNPQEVWESQSKLQSSQIKVEEARTKLLEDQADNTTKEQDIIKDKNNVVEAERDHIQAILEVNEKAQKSYKNLADGLGDIGAALDKDLGISKGLPGIADNLVRFLASMAMAPMLGKLAAIREANPSKGGYGLMGVLGAQGAFGDAFRGLDGSGNGTGGTALGSPTSMPDPGVMPSILQDTGSVASGAQSRQAAALLQQQFGNQIQGKIGGSRDNNTAKGTHDAGLSIDIPIGTDQRGPGGLGDQINQFLQQNATQLGLKYTIWRDQGTYPGGGTGFTTPGHQNHIDAHFNGQGGTGGAVYGGTGGTGALNTSGATPVFVVNMPGGGGMGGIGGTNFNLGAASAPGSGGAGGPGGGDALASSIISQAAARGLNREQTLAALAVANQESAMGTNPAAYRAQNQSGTVVTGPFQQDSSYNKYGNRNDPATAAAGFIDQFISTGQGLNNPDPWSQALAVQRPATPAGGGYNAATLQQGQRAAAEGYYNRLAGGGGPGPLPPVGAGSGGGESPFFFPGHPIPIGTGASYGGMYDTGQPAPYPGTTPGTAVPGGGVPGPAGPMGWGRPAAPGGPASAPGGPGGPTHIGAAVNSPGVAMGGTGGIGMTPGGTLDTALNVAASGLDLLAPGAGQAAQTGIKLANRAIQYGGQLASIGVSGLMETFLPTGGSELANGGWLPRIIGGLAGASPALPNVAGGKNGGQGPLTPEQANQGGGQPGGGNNIDVQYNSYNQTEDSNVDHLNSQLARLPGPGNP